MNNDAKDVIGHLRSLNIVLILLQFRSFQFPLDSLMKATLDNNRLMLLDMLSLVSELAHFGDKKSELESAIDDIPDHTGNGFYTSDYVEMWLSLLQGSRSVVHCDFSRVEDVKLKLRAHACDLLGELLQSIMWLRIGYRDRYVDGPLLPLHPSWGSFCSIAVAVSGGELSVPPRTLAVSSLRAWRYGQIVSECMKNDISNMPFTNAFGYAVLEVESAIELLERGNGAA
jgi:hypothetical protein